jgi:MSHA biogenesis protein MshM
MYQEHFNLKALPFSLTPSTEFFCNLSGHQDALNVLLFGLKIGEGFIKITGEVGTGKTLLCRTLLKELKDPFVSAYLPNPDLDPAALRLAVAQELGLAVSVATPQSELLQKINERLLQLFEQGKKPVLIVDEAQALPDASLEALRLLTNLETENNKLLQIVLFGQPELDQRLKQHQFRQLQQRITFSHYLSTIPRQDLSAYLCHRLSMAGYTKGLLFDSKACDLLYQASAGVPRIINVLCHKALLVAYGLGLPMVNAEAMKQAIGDSQPIVNKKVVVHSLKFKILIGCGTALIVAALVAVYLKLVL